MSKINLHSISNNFREREREGGRRGGGREEGKERFQPSFIFIT